MEHKPVLEEQVLDVLAPSEGEVFADLTAGFGGHAASVIGKIGKNGQAFLFDTDKMAVLALEQKFGKSKNVLVAKSNFADIDYEHLPPLDMILADLGVSSPQIDRAERGFSFNANGPLDMRMDQEQGLSAYDVVNRYKEAELAEIIYRYGDERASRKIAAAIVAERAKTPITSTKQLADLIAGVHPKYSKIDPATKTFQAIRIEVNYELENLAATLPKLAEKLAPGGRIAVISFHSGEDRIVKRFFADICTDKLDDFGQVSEPAQFQKVTKKAVKGEKLDTNPRARSAKLRAVVKNKK